MTELVLRWDFLFGKSEVARRDGNMKAKDPWFTSKKSISRYALYIPIPAWPLLLRGNKNLQQKLSGDEVHGRDLASIDVSSIIYLQVVWHAPKAQLPAPKLALKWPCSISSIVGTQEVSHDWDGLRGETGAGGRNICCALQWNLGIQCSDVLMNVSRITRSELMKKSSANDNKMTIPKTLDPNFISFS